MPTGLRHREGGLRVPLRRRCPEAQGGAVTHPWHAGLSGDAGGHLAVPPSRWVSGWRVREPGFELYSLWPPRRKRVMCIEG